MDDGLDGAFDAGVTDVLDEVMDVMLMVLGVVFVAGADEESNKSLSWAGRGLR